MIRCSSGLFDGEPEEFWEYVIKKYVQKVSARNFGKRKHLCGRDRRLARPYSGFGPPPPLTGLNRIVWTKLQVPTGSEAHSTREAGAASSLNWC